MCMPTWLSVPQGSYEDQRAAAVILSDSFRTRGCEENDISGQPEDGGCNSHPRIFTATDMTGNRILSGLQHCP